MPTPETTDPPTASPAAATTFGELLRELRTTSAHLLPAAANTRLKQKLRERLCHHDEGLILDWERGHSFPEPWVLEIYLEVLEAAPERLAQIETALTTAARSAGPLVLNPQAQPQRVALPETGPPSSQSWQRQRVRLAAEQLRQRLLAQALVERILQAAR